MPVSEAKTCDVCGKDYWVDPQKMPQTHANGVFDPLCLIAKFLHTIAKRI
ncbi:MAG: hypothetical protein OXE73_09485 [Gammaproteobacteria bacterium]|nr:hypothetical protein [Gammaproteobacteria bacterium]